MVTAKYNGTMKAMFSTYINGLCNIKPMYFPFEKYQCFVNLEFDDFRHEYYMNETKNVDHGPDRPITDHSRKWTIFVFQVKLATCLYKTDKSDASKLEYSKVRFNIDSDWLANHMSEIIQFLASKILVQYRTLIHYSKKMMKSHIQDLTLAELSTVSMNHTVWLTWFI